MSNKEYHRLTASNYAELLKKAEIEFGPGNFEIITVKKLDQMAGIRLESPSLLQPTLTVTPPTD